MIHDPLIDDFAQLPLTLLVSPTGRQRDDGWTPCQCPLCKSTSARPHFLISRRERGGLYGGHGAERWRCTATGRSGYGAIELLAAIRSYGYWWRQAPDAPETFICLGDDLRRTCLDLAKCAGNDDKTIATRWPVLVCADYKTAAPKAQQTVTVEPKTDFTPQDLAALGCATWTDRDGVERYGFDTRRLEAPWHFLPPQLHDDFHLWALSRVTLPAEERNGEMQSDTIVSTPWRPILAVYPDSEREDCGAIFFPTQPTRRPIVFSTTEEHTIGKVSRWLGGDSVFVRAVALRTSDTTGVATAVSEAGEEEPIATTRQEWVEEQGRDGTPRFAVQPVPIPERERRARAVVYCPTAADAIATYYHLKALRHTYPQQQGARWWHVCFPYGRVPFSPVHYNKCNRFAEHVYTLFPTDDDSVAASRELACRYRTTLRATLPPTVTDPTHLYAQQIYNAAPSGVRDFFLTYRLSHREAIQWDGDLRRLFSSRITSALSSDPFERKEKRDRNGVVKETYYVINPATLWEFMATGGYARDVREDTADKIGRFVHVDGPFADEIDAQSMVQVTIDRLRDYARQVNDERADGKDEYEPMVQAVLRASKEVNEKSVAALPVTHLDYTSGYGRHVEHFFYDNAALRITDDNISLVPYNSLDFNVERSELLHWAVTLPKTVPFAISENPEYTARRAALAARREEKESNGAPRYTLQRLADEENELAIWAQSHRWVVDWRGKNENELWPPLRVLRGFANEDWATEQDLLHSGRKFSSEEQMELDCRFANLLFCLGRMLWRYRDSKSNCIAYLIENVVTSQGRAEGGSGKSTFVRVFAGCAAHVLNINGRDLVAGKEFSANLAEYRHHLHRIVHWEDVDQQFDFGKLYNLTTGDFSVRYMYRDRITIPLSEGPGHVVTSNYPLHDIDDSTMRRVCLGGFSHRFCGQNTLKNKAARYISDLMPDFNAVSPDKLSATSRNQIAMICALAVQFVMRYDEKVEAQKKYMEQRTLAQSLGESFLRFSRVFFAQENVWGVPVDMDSMLEEYKEDFADASRSKADSFSPKAFRRRLADYCESAGILINPPQIFRRRDGIVLDRTAERGYFQHKAWVTCRYFGGRDWEDDRSITPKQVRELRRTEHALYFYRSGRDSVPADNNALMEAYAEFVVRPDPSPIRDDEGHLVSLTMDERDRWRAYLDARQRKRQYPTASVGTDSKTDKGTDKDDDMPF